MVIIPSQNALFENWEIVGTRVGRETVGNHEGTGVEISGIKINCCIIKIILFTHADNKKATIRESIINPIFYSCLVFLTQKKGYT